MAGRSSSAPAIVGAIVTPLNAWWTGPELEYGLVDSGAKVAFVDAERLERIAEHLVNCPDLKRVYVSRYVGRDLPHPDRRTAGGRDRQGRTTGASCRTGAMPAVDARTRGRRDHPLHLRHDRQAEGRARHPSQHDVQHLGRRPRRRRATSCAAASRCPRPIRNAPQRSTLLSVPFFHATGCFAVLSPSLFAGGKIVLMRNWDAGARDAADRAREDQRRRRRADHRLAADRASRPRTNTISPRWKSVAYGGAPSAPELVRKIMRDLPEIRSPATAGA